MATWKRLTRKGGEPIDVNLDTVLHIQEFEDHTTMHFSVSQKDGVHVLWVKEKPDEIHMAKPLPSFSG